MLKELEQHISQDQAPSWLRNYSEQKNMEKLFSPGGRGVISYNKWNNVNRQTASCDNKIRFHLKNRDTTKKVDKLSSHIYESN